MHNEARPRTRRHAGQAGEGKIGCIFWLLLLAIVVLAGWKMIPVKIASSELYDHMVETAKWGGNAPTDQIERNLFNKARELELPVDKKDVKVERIRGQIIMEVKYTVPVQFPGYTYNWDFDQVVKRDIYIF